MYGSKTSTLARFAFKSLFIRSSRKFHILSSNYTICYTRQLLHCRLEDSTKFYDKHYILRSKSGNNANNANVIAGTKPVKTDSEPSIDSSEILDEKVGLFKKFKLMYKQYWYVLIPVHVITSVGWFGGFYYMSKSGVDIPSLLQTLHISESIIERVKDSEMGHVAIAYLCYKIATPLRYFVTLGGTTIAIKYLVQCGCIKPVPSRQQLIKMYEDKKAGIVKRKQESKWKD